jgi:hypothetical protein
MITTYKQYVKKLLTQIGFSPQNIHETEDAFGRLKSTPWVVTLYQPEQMKEKQGKAAMWKDEQGNVYLRKQKLERLTILEITFGDKSEADVETHLVEFLKLLDTGIDDGEGNFVRIEPKQTKWLSRESVLKAKAGVVLFIQFTGGIYTDTAMTNAEGIEANVSYKIGGN